jgi:hypothetical protein
LQRLKVTGDLPKLPITAPRAIADQERYGVTSSIFPLNSSAMYFANLVRMYGEEPNPPQRTIVYWRQLSSSIAIDSTYTNGRHLRFGGSVHLLSEEVECLLHHRLEHVLHFWSGQLSANQLSG